MWLLCQHSLNLQGHGTSGNKYLKDLQPLHEQLSARRPAPWSRCVPKQRMGLVLDSATPSVLLDLAAFAPTLCASARVIQLSHRFYVVTFAGSRGVCITLLRIKHHGRGRSLRLAAAPPRPPPPSSARAQCRPHITAVSARAAQRGRLGRPELAARRCGCWLRRQPRAAIHMCRRCRLPSRRCTHSAPQRCARCGCKRF